MGRATIYYSVVTRKELSTKPGLKDSERQAILEALSRFRLVPVTRAVAERYALVRRQCSGLEREDALIAATAIEKRLPLMTRTGGISDRLRGSGSTAAPDGERHVGSPPRTSCSTARIAAWMRPLLATRAGVSMSSAPPVKSVTRPPASSTSRLPAATSHGPSRSSQ